MLREFNGFGQVTAEYQAVGGAVTSGTPAVEYHYDGAGSGSRLVKIVYPDEFELAYNYTTNTDAAISRLSSIGDSSGVLESYQYLGASMAVIRHRGNDTELIYVKQGSELDGEAGDQYTGLDRFGRIVDQRWQTGGGSSMNDLGVTGIARAQIRSFSGVFPYRFRICVKSDADGRNLGQNH